MVAETEKANGCSQVIASVKSSVNLSGLVFFVQVQDIEVSARGIAFICVCKSLGGYRPKLIPRFDSIGHTFVYRMKQPEEVNGWSRELSEEGDKLCQTA